MRVLFSFGRSDPNVQVSPITQSNPTQSPWPFTTRSSAITWSARAGATTTSAAIARTGSVWNARIYSPTACAIQWISTRCVVFFLPALIVNPFASCATTVALKRRFGASPSAVTRTV